MNRKYVFLTILGLLVLILLPFIGIIKIDLSTLFSENSSSFIFWQLRLPRTLLGFMAGSSLALAGLIFQNLFKNSLATPYTLGISSGASAGIVLGIKLHLSATLLGINGMVILGFGGALLSIGVILGIARLVRSYSIYTLLMSGVAINFFFSSFILITQYLFDFSQTLSILRWLMGGISVTGYRELLFLLPVFVFFILAAILLRKELVIASAGEAFAYAKGLNIRRFRIIVFITVSFIIGILVSLVGPIGFVGLIIPHISRLIFRRDFKSVLAFTIISGGLFLAITDFVSRIVIRPVEIPVGIITSLMGAPFFLFVLISHLRKNR
jgi:iron complex transport system permease protein